MPNTTVNISDYLKKKLQKSVNEYWSAARKVINAAGSYWAAVKLKENLLDPTTTRKVQHVLDKSFGGSMTKLDDAISTSLRTYNAKVRKLNFLCRQYDLYTIDKPSALLKLLISDKKRDSFRGKIKTKVKNGEICALQAFEMSNSKGPK